jgi:hypothetical protein
MRTVSPTSRNEVTARSPEVPSGDRDQTALGEFTLDQKRRHVSPPHPLEDDLFLHQLVADRPAVRAFDEMVVPCRRVPCGVADDALHVTAHLFWSDLARDRKSEKVRCHDGY